MVLFDLLCWWFSALYVLLPDETHQFTQFTKIEVLIIIAPLFLFLPLWRERISSIGSPADDCAGRWSVQVELEDTLCTDVRRHINTLKHTQTTPLNIKHKPARHVCQHMLHPCRLRVCLCDLSSPRWVKCVCKEALLSADPSLLGALRRTVFHSVSNRARRKRSSLLQLCMLSTRDCTIFTLHSLSDFYVERVTAHRIRYDHSCFHNLWPNYKTKLKLKPLWKQGGSLVFRGLRSYAALLRIGRIGSGSSSPKLLCG